MLQSAPVHADVSDNKAERDFDDDALQDQDFADRDFDEETEPSEDPESDSDTVAGDMEIIDVDAYDAPLGDVKIEDGADSDDDVIEVVILDNPEVIDFTEDETPASMETDDETVEATEEMMLFVHRYLRSGKEY